ncbi:MAG: 6-pyruvoyl-tetrahydropterin synthase-related protein [Pyrinomonadaceae bacterium]
MPAPNRYKFILLIAAISIAAMLPAYYYGVPSGNDQRQHYQFAYTVYESLSSGVLYPHFAPDTNHGFGDYGIRFYPPLTYYLLSAGYYIVGDWSVASLIVFTLVLFFSGLGVFLWVREHFDERHAVIAAFLAIVAPFHLNELYNNGLYAEFVASAVVPFCFLFVTRLCRDAKWSDTVALAVAYALLILSNLPMTVIFSITLGVYSLLMLQRSSLVSSVVKLAVAVAMSVAMTSFSWSRWITEMEWLAHTSQTYLSTTWDASRDFLLLPSHFLQFNEAGSDLWLADIMLIASLLITVPTFIYLYRNSELKNKFIYASTLTLAVAVFLTTPLSLFIWQNFSLIQKVQFPWRWLAVVSLFAPTIASIGIIRASDALKLAQNNLAAIGLASLLVPFFFASVFLMRGAVYTSNAELAEMVATVPESEGCDCWWPTWAKSGAFSQKTPLDIPDRNVVSFSASATGRRFAVDEGTASTAVIRAFYYPRWQAEINGKSATVRPDEFGRMTIDVPSESAEVHLKFVEPGYVSTANVISLIAWITALLCLVAAFFKKEVITK